jgi:hypothetical protein
MLTFVAVESRRGRLRKPALALAALLMAGACGSSATNDAAIRVHVTGFNDWKGLGEPANVWRCRDNPSCRLVVGAALHERPETHQGPLVAQLRSASPHIDWSYATLPVTWEIAKSMVDYEDYDVVVHLGLGVYNDTETLFVEEGAFNFREGRDAAGRSLQGPIANDIVGDVLHPQAESVAKVRALDGARFGAYRVEVKPARRQNAYLCNETHFWALRALRGGSNSPSRPRAAYFVHIPYATDGDYETLAEGVSGVIGALVKG